MMGIPTLENIKYDESEYIYLVNNRNSLVAFKNEYQAKDYINQMPPSISGGMFINKISLMGSNNGTT
jgi:hypothetical protein